MLVGLDFDNTIVCYDRLFHRLASERGFITEAVPATKGAVSAITSAPLVVRATGLRCRARAMAPGSRMPSLSLE